MGGWRGGFEYTLYPVYTVHGERCTIYTGNGVQCTRETVYNAHGGVENPHVHSDAVLASKMVTIILSPFIRTPFPVRMLQESAGAGGPGGGERVAQLQREVEVLGAEKLKQQAVIHDLQRNLVRKMQRQWQRQRQRQGERD
jgi:hypothetical protein